MSDLQAEYDALVDAECTAEKNALEITRDIRDQLTFGEDGKISGFPTVSVMELEAASWGVVVDLRNKRYAWIERQRPKP